MAYIPRSSFIPKEGSGAIPMQVRRKRTIHIFGLLSTIMLVASLASAVGVFLYQDFLENRLDTAREALNAASKSDNAAKIEEIRLYDNKLKLANNLLDNHLAPSLLFEEIENSAKETVQFSSLEYEYDPGFDVTLSLGGKTKTFSSVALQKAQFFEDGLFDDFLLKDISVGGKNDKDKEATNNEVQFLVSGIFEKDLLKYTGSTQTSGAVAPAPAAADASTTPEAAAEGETIIP